MQSGRYVGDEPKRPKKNQPFSNSHHSSISSRFFEFASTSVHYWAANSKSLNSLQNVLRSGGGGGGKCGGGERSTTDSHESGYESQNHKSKWFRRHRKEAKRADGNSDELTGREIIVPIKRCSSFEACHDARLATHFDAYNSDSRYRTKSGFTEPGICIGNKISENWIKKCKNLNRPSCFS